MNQNKILSNIEKLDGIVSRNIRDINKYLKSTKEPFEDRLYFYKQIPDKFKNSYKSIVDSKKFPASYHFRDIMLDFLDFQKYEKISYERYFSFHEGDIEAKIEENGFDANISEEDYLILFPPETFYEKAFSYETYCLFLEAREEWVKNNLGYYIHNW